MCKINNSNFETNLFSLQIILSCFSDHFESQQADIFCRSNFVVFFLPTKIGQKVNVTQMQHFSIFIHTIKLFKYDKTNPNSVFINWNFSVQREVAFSWRMFEVYYQVKIA